MTKTTPFGHRCPANPEHGPCLPISHERWGWYCPHSEHDGRLRGHRDGEAVPTRAFFTTIEVESGLLRFEVGTRDAKAVLA